MLKRTLFFSSPGKLNIKDGLLQYESGNMQEKKTFPLEDLGCIVITGKRWFCDDAVLCIYQKLRLK